MLIAKEQIAKNAVNESRAELTEKISHDIRSPLSALSTILDGKHELNHDELCIVKTSIERINNLASGLLSEKKTHSEQSQRFYLNQILNNVAHEFTLRYPNQNFIQMKLRNTIGVFISASKEEISSIFGNLIQNSIDSFNNFKSGHIEIITETVNNEVVIKIIDNGKGISEENLAKIGSRGFTSKSHLSFSGNGIGVYNAINYLKSIRAKLEYSSILNAGTTAKMTLQVQSKDNRFLKKLHLNRDIKTISFELSKAMQNKIDSFLKSKNLCQTITTNNLNSLDQISTKLMPCAIFSSTLTPFPPGLDETLNSIKKVAQIKILENPEDALTIKKDNHEAFITTCDLEYIQNINTNHENINSILVDDDELIRLTWKIKSKNLNHELITFESVYEFDYQKNLFSKDVQLFIDSHLETDQSSIIPLRGEKYLEHLSQQSFHNLYLTTGYTKDKFSNCSYLKDIIGKEPPFMVS